MKKALLKENLTDGQLKGLQKIQKWLQKPIVKGDISTKVFVLTGRAGTGKTTLLEFAFAQYLKNEKQSSGKGFFRKSFYDVCGVAYSHKAKNVLKERIPEAHTFASFFKLEIHYSDDGKIEFLYPKNKNQVRPCEEAYIAVIHDECSVYDYFMTNTAINDSHPNTKIIFVGDRGQLPPINKDREEIDSPSLFLDLDEDSKHELTERVRQSKENPIIDFSDFIYERIFSDCDINKTIDFIYNNSKIVNGLGLILQNKEDFILNNYVHLEPTDFLEYKILSYRNDSVNQMNNLIRNTKYSTNEKIIENENIYMNETFAEDEFPLFNSEEFITDKVVLSNYLNLKCYLIYVLKDGRNCFLRSVHPDDIHKFLIKRKELAHEALNEKDIYERKKKWKIFHDYKNSFADFSYGYAMTIYKAQGSTYKNVAVDFKDILNCQPLSNKRKLQALYTSITRASETVTFLT